MLAKLGKLARSHKQIWEECLNIWNYLLYKCMTVLIHKTVLPYLRLGRRVRVSVGQVWTGLIQVTFGALPKARQIGWWGAGLHAG